MAITWVTEICYRSQAGETVSRAYHRDKRAAQKDFQKHSRNPANILYCKLITIDGFRKREYIVLEFQGYIFNDDIPF
jgi:hypothetical protein